MPLLMKEYKELEKIQKKVALGVASSNEMETFLDLIVKNGNEFEMLNYMKTLGLNTIDEVRAEVKKRQTDSGIFTGLAIAGGAILLAALLSK
jgi:hypothetical protein